MGIQLGVWKLLKDHAFSFCQHELGEEVPTSSSGAVGLFCPCPRLEGHQGAIPMVRCPAVIRISGTLENDNDEMSYHELCSTFNDLVEVKTW